MNLEAVVLTRGQVLDQGGLRPRDLSVSDGQITDASTEGRRVDCSGLWVLPGIVDVHGDGFERHLAARRGALRDRATGLVAVEAELAANGITTATLAQFWSWEGGMRSPDAARALLDALGRYQGQGTDLRVQLRVEMHMRDDWPDIEALVQNHRIPYVVFNDHLAHEKLARGRKPPGLIGQALKAGRNPDVHWELMQRLHHDDAAVRAGLPDFARRIAATGARIGSHDDRTETDRQEWRACGATICEFPETKEAAQEARSGGDQIVLGAPNVMRGGSHKGNASATSLIQTGLCDALASDYHYPAPLHAVFALLDAGQQLPDVWPLVSAGPAAILGLTDRGTFAAGHRADIAIVDPALRRIVGTLAAGRVTYATGAFAASLLAG